MRICFIEDTMLRGGTQIWVTEAVKTFTDMGETVNVIAPKNSFTAEKSKENGANIFTYDWEEIAQNKNRHMVSWIKGIAASDVAICTVHPPRNNFHCSIFAAECIKEAGTQTVLVPKTGTIVPEYLREFYLPDPAINTRILTITEFTKRYLVEHYGIPKKKIELIYQGTEVNRFTSTPETAIEAKKRYPLTDNAEPILGSVGALEERKGQHILLQAIKELSEDTMPNIHAMIVGEGPSEEYLRNLVRVLSIEKYVSFFPFTTEPNYIFERLDILTMPSLYKEGMPNVLLEAMSMKLPCIATNIAGIPEVVKDDYNGFIINPDSVEELKNAIIKLWSDKNKCQKFGNNARKLMVKQFCKKEQFVEFLNFFKSIVN